MPWSLGEIGDKSAIPPLIETLEDNGPDMRVLAIYALEKLKAPEALPQLRALLDDDEKITSMASARLPKQLRRR